MTDVSSEAMKEEENEIQSLKYWNKKNGPSRIL